MFCTLCIPKYLLLFVFIILFCYLSTEIHSEIPKAHRSPLHTCYTCLPFICSFIRLLMIPTALISPRLFTAPIFIDQVIYSSRVGFAFHLIKGQSILVQGLKAPPFNMLLNRISLCIMNELKNIKWHKIYISLM